MANRHLWIQDKHLKPCWMRVCDSVLQEKALFEYMRHRLFLHVWFKSGNVAPSSAATFCIHKFPGEVTGGNSYRWYFRCPAEQNIIITDAAMGLSWLYKHYLTGKIIISGLSSSLHGQQAAWWIYFTTWFSLLTHCCPRCWQLAFWLLDPVTYPYKHYTATTN